MTTTEYGVRFPKHQQRELATRIRDGLKDDIFWYDSREDAETIANGKGRILVSREVTDAKPVLTLPTAPGSVIRAVLVANGGTKFLMRTADTEYHWVGVAGHQYAELWSDKAIESFTVKFDNRKA